MTDKEHNPEHDEIEESEDPQVTELVAYLDGELPEQDVDRVEQLLQVSAQLRRSAETLDRTWQLLDSLEEATASGNFTQKTLASISGLSDLKNADLAAARARSIKGILPGSVMVRGMIWCLAGFFACSSGLLLSRKARRERTDPTDARILKDLDFYRQYPKLWHIPDSEFLEAISGDAKTSSVDKEAP
uniref:Transmembrane protein n=1 Tax=uncultured bacterium A1Q1_fos_291 TaxID=1256570 RepID=L7VXC9_9BACT|nr:hypothetical protein [uncultured bacterium A1Q1_fos_291]